MSTKTNFKRVALVAVASLGAGLLSVAPASAAPFIDQAPGYTAVTNWTSSEVCSVVSSGYSYAAATQAVTESQGNNTSDTVIYTTTTAPKVKVGDIVDVDAATQDVSGSPVTAVDSSSTGGYHFTVSETNPGTDADPIADAGTVTVISPTASRITINVSNTVPTTIDLLTGDLDLLSLYGAPQSAVGNATFVELLPDGSAGLTSAAGGVISIDTTGVAAGTITLKNYGPTARVTATSTVTIVISAGCPGAVTPVAGESFVSVGGTQVQATTNVDASTTASAGTYLYANIVLNNSIGEPVAAGLWAASVTGGAKVSIAASGAAPGTPTYPFVTAAGDGSETTIKVGPGTAGVASTTTLTVTYNGAAVATRTLTFLGEATKIVVAANAVGKTEGQGMVWYSLADAAGNSVPGSIDVDPSTFTTQISNVENIKDASLAAESSTETVNGAELTADLFAGKATKLGVIRFTCGTAGAGSKALTLRHMQDVTGDYITLPVTLSCAGGVDSLTIAMDKASYKIGEIATLTVSAKDSKGNAVNDFTSTGIDAGIGAQGWVLAPSANDVFGALNGLAAGTKTYKVNMTTAGTFNAIFTISGKSATTSFTVTSSDSSLADVLKAIVSLIASINKQIAALQKALLKKK